MMQGTKPGEPKFRSVEAQKKTPPNTYIQSRWNTLVAAHFCVVEDDKMPPVAAVNAAGGQHGPSNLDKRTDVPLQAKPGGSS